MVIWNILFSESFVSRTSKSYFYGLFLFYSFFTKEKKTPFSSSDSFILSLITKIKEASWAYTVLGVMI